MLNQFKTKLVSFSRHHVFFRRSRGVFWVIKDDFFCGTPIYSSAGVYLPIKCLSFPRLLFW